MESKIAGLLSKPGSIPGLEFFWDKAYCSFDALCRIGGISQDDPVGWYEDFACLLVTPGRLAFCLVWNGRDAFSAWMTGLLGFSGLPFLMGCIGSWWRGAFLPSMHQMLHNRRAEKKKSWLGWIAVDGIFVRNTKDGFSLWNARDEFLECLGWIPGIHPKNYYKCRDVICQADVLKKKVLTGQRVDRFEDLWFVLWLAQLCWRLGRRGALGLDDTVPTIPYFWSDSYVIVGWAGSLTTSRNGSLLTGRRSFFGLFGSCSRKLPVLLAAGMKSLAEVLCFGHHLEQRGKHEHLTRYAVCWLAGVEYWPVCALFRLQRHSGRCAFLQSAVADLLDEWLFLVGIEEWDDWKRMECFSRYGWQIWAVWSSFGSGGRLWAGLYYLPGMAWLTWTSAYKSSGDVCFIALMRMLLKMLVGGWASGTDRQIASVCRFAITHWKSTLSLSRNGMPADLDVVVLLGCMEPSLTSSRSCWRQVSDFRLIRKTCVVTALGDVDCLSCCTPDLLHIPGLGSSFQFCYFTLRLKAGALFLLSPVLANGCLTNVDD
ncbi:hypothetical protein Nepgr_021723 [Nepenthes gracilis]|uniref:Uncharacterized protein n=1 Tax=Nepenthes gracilis TaxID=150966 RepID=A0AAD3SZE8_NEPGR|nr:hypothetical protein Nepgr_021723 [Nepenthes gracilis]